MDSYLSKVSDATYFTNDINSINAANIYKQVSLYMYINKHLKIKA